jgi:hypothetical protein
MDRRHRPHHDAAAPILSTPAISGHPLRITAIACTVGPTSQGNAVITATAHDRRRVARTIGVVLLIAAPGLAFGAWYSTRQPLEVLAVAERMKATLPADHYSSAVYHGAEAQRILDEKWSPAGFATLGLTGLAVGLVLLYFGFRAPRSSMMRLEGTT